MPRLLDLSISPSKTEERTYFDSPPMASPILEAPDTLEEDDLIAKLYGLDTSSKNLTYTDTSNTPVHDSPRGDEIRIEEAGEGIMAYLKKFE